MPDEPWSDGTLWSDGTGWAGPLSSAPPPGPGYRYRGPRYKPNGALMLETQLAQFAQLVPVAVAQSATRQSLAKILREAARPLVQIARPRSPDDVARLDLAVWGALAEQPPGIADFARARVREIAMLPALTGFWSTPQAGTPFTPGTPVETVISSASTTWDASVDFTGADYLTLAFMTEYPSEPVSSVVIDPSGANVAMTKSVGANFQGRTYIYYKALSGLGVTGTKTVRVTLSVSKVGNLVTRTYSGAAQSAPTPVNTNTTTSATSLSTTLSSPNADGSLELAGYINDTADVGSLTGGLTESANTPFNDANGSFIGLAGYKDGSLGSSETPGISTSSSAQRMAVAAHVVNPA